MQMFALDKSHSRYDMEWVLFMGGEITLPTYVIEYKIYRTHLGLQINLLQQQLEKNHRSIYIFIS